MSSWIRLFAGNLNLLEEMRHVAAHERLFNTGVVMQMKAARNQTYVIDGKENVLRCLHDYQLV